MKKLINNPETIVHEMCAGIVAAHPHLSFDPKYKVLYKREIEKDKVTLISGGGSGHEPAHGGFVGFGMLDAAVCGDVFASPSQIQVYQGIKKTAGDKGTLLIIKNYTGDVMNFKNAAHLAGEDGINVDYVIVDDDIAVKDSLYTVGRRGVAGTIFVHKIAGAVAEQGGSLAEVKAAAEKVIKNVRSIGIALTSCTLPAKGTPTFDLADGEIEYGIGIHGEPGIKREKHNTALELAGRMANSICDELDLGKADDRVSVLINGFGATPLMELYLLNNEVYKILAGRGVSITRSFVGNFMTSIDMAGASISVLKLDAELEKLLDAMCETPALHIIGPAHAPDLSAVALPCINEAEVSFSIETPADYAVLGDAVSLKNMMYIIDCMSDTIIKNETAFCELDSHAGDGDFGTSVAGGFKQIKREWKSIIAKDDLTIGSFLDACSMIIMEHCGGASGPVWGSGFRAAAKYVGDKSELNISEFAEMMQATVKGVQDIGERAFGRGAVLGDKTLIDALIPCAEVWSECAKAGEDLKSAFRKGADAAIEGAKSTEAIAAKMGRAGTVGERSIGHPDAGAYALGVIFSTISETVR